MRPRFRAISASLLLLSVASTAAAADVPLWGRWEGEFTAAAAADPRSTELRVELRAPSGRVAAIEGFFDGDATWRARFRPDEEGEWRYDVSSTPAVPGLSGISGSFSVQRSAGASRFLRHGPVRVARSGTHLEHADGTPFFWMGDTVWNGTLLSSKADWDLYLDDRARKGYSVVQYNAIAPWRTAASDAEGEVAFTREGDDVAINPRFFRRLDERLEAANARGFLGAHVLLWSLTSKDPGAYLPEAAIIRIVRYEIARYGAHHVLWLLAGDNPYDAERAERWKRVGRAVFSGRPHAPVTTHPTGMNWPWDRFRGEDWLDVLGYQSGHGDSSETLEWIHSGPPAKAWREMLASGKPRPIVNLEPPYEHHVAYQSKKRHSAHNVRRAVWWSLLATPIAGFTYGGHGLWSWHSAPGQEPTDHKGTGIAPTWREALDLPAGGEMRHVAALMAEIAWWTLRPAPDLLESQPGGGDPARFVAAARSETGDLALLYFPAGGGATLRDGSPLGANPSGEWLDPRTGERRAATSSGARVFTAPSSEDWVLVLRRK